MAKAKKVKPGTDEEKQAKITSELIRILKHFEDEIAMVVPDYDDYVLLTIGKNQLSYTIKDFCPREKSHRIEKVIIENAALLLLTAIREDIE